ncbi:MAG TPA: RNA-binding protein [Sulfurimonas sp. UBA12504]|nr:MAG TPA: RNA-binding protein [Sulfurimonas sp. UBA12504]
MNDNYPEKNFLELIIKNLASKPNDVKIVRTVDEMGVLYTVSVAQEDVPKIIGKEGETARSIRNLLRIVAFDNKVRATMKIDAPYVGRKEKTVTK